MRRTRLTAAVLCAGMLLPGVAVAAPSTDTVAGHEHHVGNRGEIVSATVVARLDRQEVADYLAGRGLDPAAARHGVDLYLVTYRTPGVDGRPTTASALSVLPRTDRTTLRTVAWLHGTRVYRYTGSVEDNLDRAVAVLFATAGHATVAPDYLGLGVGPGHHPYMLSRPTVTATVDALRATRTLATRSGKRLDRGVLLTGFSQGGQVSMLVGRELQRSHEFDLGAVAAIAGPHDIRGEELPAALDGRLDGVSAVLYLGYAITSWNRFYGLYDSPSEAFRAPYDRVVEGLFDGSHPEEDIVAALPDTPQELFTDDFLALLAKPTGTLRGILAANDDACDWRPSAPVRLYAGHADRDVVFSNSVSCKDSLGGRARLVDLGDVDHVGSAVAAVPDVAAWFDTLRPAR